MNKHRHIKFGVGRPWVGTAVASLLLSATACGAPPPENKSRSETQTMVSEAGSKTHIVEISQFKFWPETLTVQEGDMIIWRNLDVVPHTATELSREWDSGNLGKDNEWSMVVDATGRQDYFCVFHPSMKGSIIIEKK